MLKFHFYRNDLIRIFDPKSILGTAKGGGKAWVLEQKE